MTTDAAAPARPEARNPRGFADRRGRDLIAERWPAGAPLPDELLHAAHAKGSPE